MIHKFKRLQNLYNDESLGLTTEKKLFDYLKTNGETGYTLSKIHVFKKSQEVLPKRRGDISFVAEGPFERFQICQRVGSTMILNIYLLVWMYTIKGQRTNYNHKSIWKHIR